MTYIPYTLEGQIQQDLEDTKNMTEEERANFLISSIESHFLLKKPHPLPQEDSREIVVNTRRGGKTSKLYDIIYSKIAKGLDVLFVSQNPQATKQSFKRFATEFKLMTDYYNEDLTNLIVGDTFSKGQVTFASIGTLKSRGYPRHSYDYRVIDNALIEYYDFDLVSVNGVIKK